MPSDDTKTKTGDDAKIPVPPAILSGEEIYDMLMEKIEPELMSKQKDLLAERYKNETPEENTLRGKRYAAALAEYDRQYAEYCAKMEHDVSVFKRTVTSGTETRVTSREKDNLSSLESQMDDA